MLLRHRAVMPNKLKSMPTAKHALERSELEPQAWGVATAAKEHIADSLYTIEPRTRRSASISSSKGPPQALA